FTQAKFHQDELVQDGVIRQLEIVGEAVVRISGQFRDKHPEWPWASMRAMRNHLVHGYANVRLDIVWETVVNDLPALVKLAETALEDLLGEHG
ncbi:protein containing DUF86, partial [mine drainage metagenome]